MPFDGKIGLGADVGKLLIGQADIDLDDAMAVRAGEVMMVVLFATDTIVVRSVRELDAIEQTERDQFLYRTIDGGATQMWLG